MTPKQTVGLVGGVIAAFFFLIIAFSSFYTVDEGERAIVFRNGSYVSTSSPGLHFKTPIIDSVVTMSVQDHFVSYKMEAYSRDQQPADITLTVSYRLPVDTVQDVYRAFGSREGLVDRLLTRKTLEETKTVFGTFNAETAIRERGRLNAAVRAAIAEGTEGRLVIVTGVQIEDIKFSQAYEQSIEARMKAEVEVQRERQNLDREKVLADIVRTKALAEADQVREAAKALAEKIEMQGLAEARAIDARGKALRDNPSLIELVKAERWDGVLPKTVLPGTAIPLIGNRD